MRASGTETIRYQDWRDGPFYELYICVVRVGSAHIKAANVRVCMQMSQWRAGDYRARMRHQARKSEARAEKNDPQLTEVKLSGKFRLTMGRPDDYIVTTRRAELTKAGAKLGYDAKLEAEARRYLALAPDRRERPWFEPRIDDPDPDPLIGRWRDRCAEGRRWHKTEAFRYPAEMNRGGGWCA